MDAFFTRRLDGYEAHMLAHWADDYKNLGPTRCRPARNASWTSAAGRGWSSDEIFRRFPEMQVVGRRPLPCDARKAARTKHAGRALELICGSYFTVEFPGPFDAVVSFESLHHFTAAEKGAAFRKIHKALAPGGVFLNGDYFARCPEEEALLRETLERRRAAAHIPPDVFIHFDTPLTVAHEMQALRDAGFPDVRVAAETEGAVVLCAQKA